MKREVFSDTLVNESGDSVTVEYMYVNGLLVWWMSTSVAPDDGGVYGVDYGGHMAEADAHASASAVL